MQFSPYSSPIPLVFRAQVSSRNFEGFPWAGALNDGGVGKIGDFRSLSRNIFETMQECKIWLKLLLITNRNVYMRFRLVPKSVTLDDLERINGRFTSLYLPKWRFSASLRKNMSQTISNIRPRILLTINRKSTGSIDELRIICQRSSYMLSRVTVASAGLSCFYECSLREFSFSWERV